MLSAASELDSLGGNDSRGVWRVVADLALALHRAASAHAGGVPGPATLSFRSYSPTIGETVNELLAVKARGCRSDSYIYQLHHCFDLFMRGRSRRPLDSVTTKELEKWLHSMQVSARTERGRIQYLRLLWNFAKVRGYVD